MEENKHNIIYQMVQSYLDSDNDTLLRATNELIKYVDREHEPKR